MHRWPRRLRHRGVKVEADMKKIIILITLFSSSYLSAFNWDKCTRKYKNPVLGLPISTTSFVSSTGACAMISMAAHDKKVFIAHNLNNLQSDSARGDGEYLSAYASLSGCNKITSERLKKSLQTNFTDVFGHNVDNLPERAYEEIEELIFADPILKLGCKIKV